MDYKKYIKTIQDYPIKGIQFRDLTPLLSDGNAYYSAVQELAEFSRKMGATKIISPEARGFVIGAPLALALGVGFIPVRKPGKLPREYYSYNYTLEYGTNTLEMHKDALNKDDIVIIADDLLATGGTIKACLELAKQAGAKVVGAVFLMELVELNGKDILGEIKLKSLMKY